MAVLTEAIEAERGAGAGTAAGLVVTVTITALAETFTVVVDELALVLDLLTMTVSTARPVARVGMTERMTDALAVIVNAAEAEAAPRAPNLLKMNVIGALFSYNSSRRDSGRKN